jgi:protein-S-isoprenylcysteine O-methyltransferase Ste14
MITGVPLTIIFLSLIAAFYIMHLGLIRHFDPLREKGSSINPYFTAVGLTVSATMILQPALMPWLGVYVHDRWGLAIQLAGLILYLAGMVLHYWARHHLRHYFGERVEYQAGQNLIDSGPYAYMRHPIYTSLFLLASGLLLVNPSLFMLLVALYTFWEFTRVVKREEPLLSQHIPGYSDYMKRTPRFIPRWHKK